LEASNFLNVAGFTKAPFSFNDPDLYADMYSYSTLALAGYNRSTLTDSETLTRISNRIYSTYFQSFISLNNAFDEYWAYQPIGASLPFGLDFEQSVLTTTVYTTTVISDSWSTTYVTQTDPITFSNRESILVIGLETLIPKINIVASGTISTVVTSTVTEYPGITTAEVTRTSTNTLTSSLMATTSYETTFTVTDYSSGTAVRTSTSVGLLPSWYPTATVTRTTTTTDTVIESTWIQSPTSSVVANKKRRATAGQSYLEILAVASPPILIPDATKFSPVTTLIATTPPQLLPRAVVPRTLSSPVPSPIIATITTSVPVLAISTVALFLSVGILVILILSTLIVFLKPPKSLHLLPRDVDSPASLLAFVYRSEKLQAWVKEQDELGRLGAKPRGGNGSNRFSGSNYKRAEQEEDDDVWVGMGYFRGSDGTERWGMEVMDGVGETGMDDRGE
jgi:hypothetical protein